METRKATGANLHGTIGWRVPPVVVGLVLIGLVVGLVLLTSCDAVGEKRVATDFADWFPGKTFERAERVCDEVGMSEFVVHYRDQGSTRPETVRFCYIEGGNGWSLVRPESGVSGTAATTPAVTTNRVSGSVR